MLISQPTTIFIYVGGKGEISNTETPKGGYNGGGDGYLGSGHTWTGESFNCGYGGGGGGGTDIRFFEQTESSRLIVAGGGGGQGAQLSSEIDGGAGGGKEGEDGDIIKEASTCGKKGTQSSGGDSGMHDVYKAQNGDSVKGGAATGLTYSGGGGGGGYFGGGGSYENGGGGGSGYINRLLTFQSMETGVNQGDGKVIISKLLYAILVKKTCAQNYFHLLFIIIIIK